MRALVLGFAFVTVCLNFETWADCNTPAGKRGHFIYRASHELMAICDGANWINAPSGSAWGGGPSCSGGNAGEFRFRTDSAFEFYFCNGSNFRSLDAGDDGVSCAGNTGKLQFDSASGKLRYCGGANWRRIVSVPPDPCAAPNPPSGAICADGTIFVGKFVHPGTDLTTYRYFVTRSGCRDTGAIPPDTVNCPGGADIFVRKWDSSGTPPDIAAVANVPGVATKANISGQVNTQIIAAFPNTEGAQFCENMVSSHHPDWFLPSKSEMAFLYCKATPTGTHNTLKPDEEVNCTSIIGGKQSAVSGFGVTPSVYLTSSEASAPQAFGQSFLNGGQGFFSKGTSYFVRCMRRIPD